MNRIELEFMPSNIFHSRKHYGHQLETPKSNPIYIKEWNKVTIINQ